MPDSEPLVVAINLGSAMPTSTIGGFGGLVGDRNAHPEGLALDISATGFADRDG